MEFLLQLIADLFTGEPLVEEVENVSEIQREQVMEVEEVESVGLQTATEGVVDEEPNFFSLIQFH
jgi:chemotaxis signal transduction protein